MPEQPVVVVPLPPDGLRAAIVGPAVRAGLTVEPELVEMLVHDVGAQPGALPLLQYALTELYERRAEERLTVAAYRASGGVLGALARRADELYATLEPPGQAAACRLFLRLISLGEGTEDTRRRVPRSELAGVAGATPRMDGGMAPPEADRTSMDEVIARYGRYRLLTFDRDLSTREPTVEVAHEALIRSWPRLRDWLQADREGLRLHRHLTEAARAWAAREHDPAELYRGTRLAQAVEWVAAHPDDLNMLEQVFLEAAQKQAACEAAEREAHRQRELAAAQHLAAEQQWRADEQARAAKRLRRRALWLTGALVLAVVLAGAALFLGNQARQNALAARQSAAAAEATRNRRKLNSALRPSANSLLRRSATCRRIRSAVSCWRCTRSTSLPPLISRSSSKRRMRSIARCKPPACARPCGGTPRGSGGSR
jgi:hypothetical protein